jgi:hypothetical protein
MLKSKQEKDRNKIPDSMFSFDIYSLVQRNKLCDVELVVDDAFGNGSAKYHAHHVILSTQSMILQLVRNDCAASCLVSCFLFVCFFFFLCFCKLF